MNSFFNDSSESNVTSIQGETGQCQQCIRSQFSLYHMPSSRMRRILTNELYVELLVLRGFYSEMHPKHPKKRTVAPQCEWHLRQSLRTIRKKLWLKPWERLQREYYWKERRNSENVIEEKVRKYVSLWMSNTPLRRMLSHEPHIVGYRRQRPVKVDHMGSKQIQRRLPQTRRQWGKCPRPRSST